MMATFEGLNWPALGVLLACFSTLGSLGLVFGKTTQRITAIEDTLRDEIKPRLDKIDKRLDRLEDKIDKRFDSIEIRFNQIEERFDKLYNLLLKKQ